jgi:hypothetical protein
MTAVLFPWENETFSPLPLSEYPLGRLIPCTIASDINLPDREATPSSPSTGK